MSNGAGQNSLDSLAHIANMSHELQILNQQIKNESPCHTNVSSSQPGPALSETSGTPTLKSGKTKRMACVECRQQKSRCDAHEKQPSPCSRCAKKGLKCDLKSDYKRTYKRARIAQIEKEFLELKKTLSDTQVAQLLGKVPLLSNSQSPVPSSDSPQIQTSLQSHSQLPINQQYYDGRQTFQTQPLQGQPSSRQPFDGQNTQQNHNESWPVSISPYNNIYDPKTSNNSSETNNSIPNTPSIYRPMEQHVDSKQDSETFTKTIIPEYALVCEEKTLDTITLSPETIRSLYLEYVDCYHPILPVVDVLKGPERIYKLCPALFWVMMFISLRRFHNDSQKTLLMQLPPLIKDILAEITISPISRYNPTEEDKPILNACSVYSVQAFLLYTFWPPITSSLSADTSWNTIGVALFQAIRIGLHNPSMVLVNDNNVTPQQRSMAQEQAKTWIICNIVSQTIATSFGFPAFVQFDSYIWSACRPGSSINIPRSIQFMMEIAHFEDQVSKTLNSNPMDSYGLIDPTERLPLLKVLLRQLDELEIKLANELQTNDDFRKFQLLTARVHLLTYYFMDSSRISHFELQKGLVRLYNAAISLINYAQLCQAKDKRFVKYLPGVYILNIWQASCIIGKLTHSPLKKVIDIGSGKQSYQAAISLAAKASILKHDVAHRSSGIMRNMWQLFRTLDEKKLTCLSINIRTRMAASVFFDSLYLLREQVGMIKLNNRNDEDNGNAEDEENEEGGSYDEEEYGFQENEEAVVSDNDTQPKDGSQKDSNSQKSTPGSNVSSKTRRQRSLSNTVNAESKARKIIRTIPLDPQPISVTGKRSSVFKANNSNDASPKVKSEKVSPDSSSSSYQHKSNHSLDSQIPAGFSTSNAFKSPATLATAQSQLHKNQINYQQSKPVYDSNNSYNNNNNSTMQSVKMAISGNSINRSMSSSRLGSYNKTMITNTDNNPTNITITNSTDDANNTANAANSNLDLSLTDMVFNESPLQGGLENLEMDGLHINSDLLWKDVDSVMNDFGFHTQ